jgi:hypothetical protein
MRLPNGSQYWSVTFSNYLWTTCCHMWVIFSVPLAGGPEACQSNYLWATCLPFVSDIYLWWHSILAECPEACKWAHNFGVPLSATFCEQLAAICERYLPMVTQHFAWKSWGLPKGSQYWSVTFSNYLWTTFCHLWVIFTYNDSAFWLEVLRPAKATICEQLAAICERYLPMVTQHFGWRSWGLPKGSQYWSATFSNYLWASCCHLWAIITYGDTAFWLEILRLAKGLPILECHLQQLFVSNLLAFVSNLLPFVSDIYLWWHSILAWGPEACQGAPNIGVPHSATICEQLAAICER